MGDAQGAAATALSLCYPGMLAQKASLDTIRSLNGG